MNLEVVKDYYGKVLNWGLRVRWHHRSLRRCPMPAFLKLVVGAILHRLQVKQSPPKSGLGAYYVLTRGRVQL
jgi:hypothetical protein